MRPHPLTAGTRLATALALASVLATCPGAAHAGTSAPMSEPTAPLPGAFAAPTPEAAREFIDTRVPALLADHGAPGILVTVVADGEMVASGSHGVADLADGTPLDEQVHGFPTASVAKSFTAVAVLQLAEQGLLDLHEDVNTYLSEEYRLPDTHPEEPVTLHHLLTHTPGLDERTSFEDPDDPDGQRDLEEFLRQVTPERIFAPGEYSAYSNYGTGLAGFVVQEVSGVPFEDYVVQNVFEPLGMADSEFGQLHELGEHHTLVTAHTADGSAIVQDHIPLVPAGGAVTTTADMGRFMLALLNGGEVEGTRVLSEESVELMLGRRFEHHPDATAMGYGTYEWRTGPSRAVGHGGDLNGLHTGYLLLPEQDTGIFVAVNGDDTDPEAGASPLHDLRFSVLHDFAEEFAPTDPITAEADPGADLGLYAGSYITTRRPAEGALRLLTLFDNITVRDAGDGTLRLSGLLAPNERLLPLGDHVFVGEESQERLFFDVQDGRSTILYLDLNPTSGYDRTSVVESPTTHRVVLAASLLFLLTGLVQLWRPGPGARSVAVVFASLTAVACLSGTGLVVYALADQNRMADWLLGASSVLTVPFALAVPGALVTVVLAALAWRGNWWGTVRRVHYSLLPLAAFLALAVAIHYHLVWPLG
ncbi:serine hydrolase domain-containing protein [Nocardiopsis alkaliphila]|uniref:serine hydrolase domain-containing protein n=1 Tax=Nocardiopsis alkaliphila TaxID=225762 RepID=UPI000344BF54|nr:serine hydrolase domain-containing protein [Nocardiopsis alkaliphila]